MIERLLVGACGSVAVLSLPSYLQAFRQAGVSRIVTVMTGSAEQLLPASTLDLLCDEVLTDTRSAGRHVTVARWAQQVLVLPASAHLLGCAAQGLAPNLLSTTLLAVPDPIIFAPAMNPVMWARPSVRRNVDTLRGDGHMVIDPVPGQAWEVASRQVAPSLVIPDPQTLIARLG